MFVPIEAYEIVIMKSVWWKSLFNPLIICSLETRVLEYKRDHIEITGNVCSKTSS